MEYKECPCCGNKTLTTRDEFEICGICGWEDDDVQSSDPDFAGGANDMSLNEAKKALAEGKPIR